jgi:hypothetical protein
MPPTSFVRRDWISPRPGEESQRHALEVLVEAVAQLLHHPLTDAVGDVGLQHADRAGHDRDADHDPDQNLEERQIDRQQDGMPVDHVSREKCDVEDDRDEHWIHHACAGRDDYQEGDGRHPGAMRLEESGRLAHELPIGDPARGLLAPATAEGAAVHHGRTPEGARGKWVINSTVAR